MNFKSLASLALSALLLFFNAAPAMAVTFNDIGSDYWAYTEIIDLAEKGIIAGYPDNTFKPENTVNRAEFTKMVIMTLDKDDMPVDTENIFLDLSPEFWAYEDILRSKELGLVVGYPDNTFQPQNTISKAEATSIISKTIKNDYEKPCSVKEPCECEEECECAEMSECKKPCDAMHSVEKEYVLKQFEDYEKLANWTKKSFKKAVKHDLYVNYPDKNYLTPNKEMTRAETAVLLYKLRKNPAVIMADFQGPKVQEEIVAIKEETEPEKLMIEEYTTVIEHLPITPYTGNISEVEIYGPTATILAYNIIPVRFEGGFKSKKVAEGELVNLTFTKKLETVEGTDLVPVGSKLVAKVVELKKGRMFHRNGRIDLEITDLVTPSGDVYPLNATIVNNELLNKKFGKCNYKRLGIVGGSITAFGSLLGLVIGAFADEIGEGAALGSIIGAGTGLIVGLVAPGCSVEIPEEQEIYVKLQNNLEVKAISK